MGGQYLKKSELITGKCIGFRLNNRTGSKRKVKLDEFDQFKEAFEAESKPGEAMAAFSKRILLEQCELINKRNKK